jgi:aspartate ammonia-lyase
MPNKVNPVITEMVTQVAFQVISCDQAITLAALSGQLELNAFLPLITFNLINALKLLIDGVTIFRTHCIEGIEANTDRCRQWLEESLCLATALAPYIGYDKAAELSKKAASEGKTIREAAIEDGLFTPEELDAIFTPRELTRPGIAGGQKLKQRKRG